MRRNLRSEPVRDRRRIRTTPPANIRYLPDRPDAETENWVARDGLVVIPKSAVIPDDTVI